MNQKWDDDLGTRKSVPSHRDGWVSEKALLMCHFDAFYEPIRNSDKTFTGVLFKESNRFDCCLGPVNLSSVAVMKPLTFSKRWKMRGDALVNEVCYYAKRDIAAGEELLCFDGIWGGSGTTGKSTATDHCTEL